MNTRRTAGAVLALLVTITVASCGDDEPATQQAPPPPVTGSPSTSTTEPAQQRSADEQAAAAALLGYLKVRDQAYATGRISKKLNTYATGREHFGLQQFVTALNEEPKTHFKGEWSHEVVKTTIESDLIMVTDCQDATGVSLIRDRDGSVLPWFKDESGKEVPRRVLQAYRVVSKDGETWKVESGASNPNRPKKC